MWEKIAFVVGIVAVALELLIYISSKRERILIAKISAASTWTVNNFLLKAYTGALLQLVAIARSSIFFYRGKKKWADSIAWLFIFIAITLMSPIVSWHGAVSLLPAIGSVFAVISFYSKPVYIIRGTSVFALLPWLIYHVLMGNITGVVGTTFGLTSIAVGTVKDLIAKLKSKQQTLGKDGSTEEVFD